MSDRDVGLVADLPAGVVQAPHQVDVLAEHQTLVEAVAERLAPGHHRRARHVPHPCCRDGPAMDADPCRAPSARARTRRSGPRCPLGGDDPRRDQGRPPGRPGGRAAGRETRTAGRNRRRGTRPAASSAASQAGVARGGRRPGSRHGERSGRPTSLGDGGDRRRHRGAVVDDDHAAGRPPAAPGTRAAVRGRRTPARRSSPRSMARGGRAGGSGMSQAGVEQTTGEQSLGLILADRLAGQPGARTSEARARGQREQRGAASRRAGPRRPATNLDTGGEVADASRRGRASCHQAVRPPSTGTPRRSAPMPPVRTATPPPRPPRSARAAAGPAAGRRTPPDRRGRTRRRWRRASRLGSSRADRVGRARPSRPDRAASART